MIFPRFRLLFAFWALIATIALPLQAAVTLEQGKPAEFSATASGTAPFSYEWRKDGVVIPSATLSQYTIPAMSPDLAGVYTVKISNSAGSVTATETVIVRPPAPVVIPPTLPKLTVKQLTAVAWLKSHGFRTLAQKLETGQISFDGIPLDALDVEG